MLRFGIDVGAHIPNKKSNRVLDGRGGDKQWTTMRAASPKK
jgi:hypothetical protein